VTVRREWLEKDYYADLGVSKSDSAKDIKRAYRKLAQQYHPDTTSGDPASEARFKEVNEAYSVVSDPKTREEYDQARDAFQQGAYAGGPGAGGGSTQYVTVDDLGDIFGGGGGFGGLGDLFGRGAHAPQQGGDLETELSLTFHEAISGATRTMSLAGRDVQVKIPAGVNDGAKIRLRGKGQPGGGGGPPGDLFVRIHASSHPVFGRSGKDLKIDVPVTFAEATLGAKITVPTLAGSVTLRVPEGTPSGKKFKVSGKGVETSKGTGDLIVTVLVTVPKELDDEQRALLEQLRAQDEDTNPREHLGV
jgi:molecular chaperone DnaJ